MLSCKKTLNVIQEKMQGDQLFDTSLFWEAIYLENPYERKMKLKKNDHLER